MLKSITKKELYHGQSDLPFAIPELLEKELEKRIYIYNKMHIYV